MKKMIDKTQSNKHRSAFFLEATFLFILLCFTPLILHAEEQLEGDWVRFDFAAHTGKPDWRASSVLESDNPLTSSRYGPEKALDGDPATSWVEGAPGPGIGENYAIALSHVPEALGFHNGYAKNQNLFSKNYRVKALKVRVFVGVNISGFATEQAVFYDALPITESRTIHLNDTMKAQRVALPFDTDEIRTSREAFRTSEALTTWDFPQAEEMGLDGSEGPSLSFRYIIQLTIADTYPGSTWEDTCIAELWPDYGSVSDVSISDDNRKVMITGEAGKQIPTYFPFEYVLTLVETSENHEWAVVIKEPAYPDSERVTSEYALIHTPTGRDMNAEIFGNSVQPGIDFLPVGFITKESATLVEYEDLENGDMHRAPCTLY